MKYLIEYRVIVECNLVPEEMSAEQAAEFVKEHIKVNDSPEAYVEWSLYEAST